MANRLSGLLLEEEEPKTNRLAGLFPGVPKSPQIDSGAQVGRNRLNGLTGEQTSIRGDIEPLRSLGLSLLDDATREIIPEDDTSQREIDEFVFGGFLEKDFIGTTDHPFADTDFRIGSVPAAAIGFVKRLGKQAANIATEIAHGLGKSDDPADFLALSIQSQRQSTRGEFKLTGTLAEDELGDIKYQLSQHPELREDDDLRIIAETYSLGGEPNPFPQFNLPPAENPGEYIADTLAGIGSFVLQIVFLKKVLPGAPSQIIWEIQSIAEGNKPGRGAAINASLSMISKIPTTSFWGKGIKMGAGGTLFGGLTFAEGGDWIDVAVSAGIGMGFQGWDIRKQDQFLKRFKSQLKQAEYEKVVSKMGDEAGRAKAAHDKNIKGGMSPEEAKFKFQGAERAATQDAETQLRRMDVKINKAMDVVARRLHHGKLAGKEKELAEKLVKEGLTAETGKEVSKVKLKGTPEARFEKAKQEALKLTQSKDPKKRRIGNAQLDLLEKQKSARLRKDIFEEPKPKQVEAKAKTPEFFLKVTDPETGKSETIHPDLLHRVPSNFKIEKVPFEAGAKISPLTGKPIEPLTEEEAEALTKPEKKPIEPEGEVEVRKIPNVLYHGTSKRWKGDFKQPQKGVYGSEAVFLSPTEQGAEYYVRDLDTGEVKSFELADNLKIWDYDNPQDFKLLEDYIKKVGISKIDKGFALGEAEFINLIKQGSYAEIQRPAIMDFLRKSGYDGFIQVDWYDFGRDESIGIFNPKNIKEPQPPAKPEGEVVPQPKFKSGEIVEITTDKGKTWHRRKVASGINPLTKKPIEPVVEIGGSVFADNIPRTMVNLAGAKKGTTDPTEIKNVRKLVKPEGEVPKTKKELAKEKIKARKEKIPPRPLVNPNAGALARDKQLRKQTAWDKKYGKLAKPKVIEEELENIRPKTSGIGKGRFWEYKDKDGTWTVAPTKEKAIARAKAAEGEAVKRTFTNTPTEWLKETTLNDWGAKGLRTPGNRQIKGRKSFPNRTEYTELLTNLPPATMKALKARTDEIFKVNVRKKGKSNFWLAPTVLVKQLKEELGDEAFIQKPTSPRSPKQLLNDNILSMKVHELEDWEIGQNILNSIEGYGLTEDQLSKTAKGFIDEFKNIQTSEFAPKSVREAMEREIPPEPDPIAIAEREAIQQEDQFDEDIGDMLDRFFDFEDEPKEVWETKIFDTEAQLEQFVNNNISTDKSKETQKGYHKAMRNFRDKDGDTTWYIDHNHEWGVAEKGKFSLTTKREPTKTKKEIAREKIKARKAKIAPIAIKKSDINEYLKLKNDFNSMKFNFGTPQAKKLQNIERKLIGFGILTVEESFKAPSGLKEKMISRLTKPKKVEVKKDLLGDAIHPSEVVVRKPTPKQGELFVADPTEAGVAKGEPGFAGITDRPGGKVAKPFLTMNRIKSPDKEIESFFGRTRRMPAGKPGSLIQRLKAGIRERFIFASKLIDTPDAAIARDMIRTMPETRRAAREKAVNDMVYVMNGDGTVQTLDNAGLDLLRRKVFIADLIEEAKIDRSVAGDFSLEQLEAENTRLDELIDKIPSVKKAFDRRQQLWSDVSQDLLKRGVLTQEQAANKAYVRHFVLDFMEGRKQGAKRSALKQPFRKYTVRRKGSKRDISTDYLEVELKALGDIYADNAIEDIANDIGEIYDAREIFADAAKERNKEEGNKLATPESIANENGFVEWHYKRPNFFYRAQTYDESKIAQMVEDSAETVGEMLHIPKKAIREALVVGRRKGMLIPEWLAAQLDDLPVNKRSGFVVESFSKPINKWWKRWILRINPIRYNTRNMIGDLERLHAAGKTKSLKKAGQAIKILFKKEGEIYQTAQKFGVIGSSLWHEMGSAHKIKDFERFRKISTSKDFMSVTKQVLSLPIKIISRMGQFIQDMTQAREDILRMAVYLQELDNIKSGEKLHHWMGWVKDVEAIAEVDPERAAAKISRETLIDYGSFTPFEDNVLRNGWILFYSFLKRNYTGWIHAPQQAALDGVKIKYSPKIAWNISKWLMRVLGLYAVGYLWNHRDDKTKAKERAMPVWLRARPHLHVGDGVIWSQTAMSDFSEWFEFDQFIGDLQRMENGYLSGLDVGLNAAKNVAIGHVNKLYQALNPFPKAVVTSFGVRTFPDVTKPTISAKPGSKKAMENAVLEILGADARKAWQTMGGKRDFEDLLMQYFAGSFYRSLTPEQLAEQLNREANFVVLKRESKTTGRKKGGPRKGKEQQYEILKSRVKALRELRQKE